MSNPLSGELASNSTTNQLLSDTTPLMLYSSVMYSSVSRVRVIWPSNCIKRLSGLNQLGVRKAVKEQITSSIPFVLRPVSRTLRTTSAVRMDSIITPEKAMGHSAAPKSELAVKLTAPNGRKYTQPIGLFINNEWVKSSNGQKITTVNPTYEYVHQLYSAG
jgi:hypothetical protein